jgi:hypothetical protein
MITAPAVDDRYAQVEPERTRADDDDRRALHALVDRAAHPADGVFHDAVSNC